MSELVDDAGVFAVSVFAAKGFRIEQFNKRQRGACNLCEFVEQNVRVISANTKADIETRDRVQHGAERVEIVHLRRRAVWQRQHERPCIRKLVQEIVGFQMQHLRASLLRWFSLRCSYSTHVGGREQTRSATRLQIIGFVASAVCICAAKRTNFNETHQCNNRENTDGRTRTAHLVSVSALPIWSDCRRPWYMHMQTAAIAKCLHNTTPQHH